MIIHMRKFIYASFFLGVLFLSLAQVRAQDADILLDESMPLDASMVAPEEGQVFDAAQMPSPSEQVTGAVAAQGEPLKSKPSVSFTTFPSLFFTYWQHEAIKDAKNSRGFARPPTQAELDAMQKGDEALMPAPDPGLREISLGGIVYNAGDSWTIWMNGQRVTPDAIPKEVLDLRVYKDHIDVKWLDEYTNRIFPVRLRAHQRFNLDMRIFLPG